MSCSWMVRALMLVGALAMSSVVLAAAQVSVGSTYEFSISGNDGPGCFDPNSSFSDSGTMTITNVSGNIFDAKLSFNGDDGDGPATATLNNLSGALDGQVQGCGAGICPVVDNFGSNIDTIAGSISPSSVSLSGNGTDNNTSPGTSPGTSCTFTFSLTGSATFAINPETTATAAQTQQADAQSALSPTGVVGQLTRYTSSLTRPRANTLGQVTANSAQFSSRGMSAGDHMDVPLGVWLSGSYTDSEDDSTAPFESERLNLTGGVDTTLAEGLIAGLSLGLESADTRTSANNGQSDSFGFTVAPYMAYLVNDAISVDFAVGYSRMTSRVDRDVQ